MSTPELLPCPFNHPAVTSPAPPYVEYDTQSETAHVECGYCGARGPYCNDRSEAIAAWNTRTHARASEEPPMFCEWNTDDCRNCGGKHGPEPVESAALACQCGDDEACAFLRRVEAAEARCRELEETLKNGVSRIRRERGAYVECDCWACVTLRDFEAALLDQAKEGAS